MTADDTFDKYFPFQKLGLRKNPFGTLTNEEWVAVTIPPPIVYDVLNAGFDHLQIIGDRGTGKSTTLRWLCHHFATQGQQTAYERLPRWQFNFHSNIQNLDYFALDEAQRLFVLHQQRLFREAQGKHLLIGTHTSWQRMFRIHQQTVTTIHIAEHTTCERVQAMLARRLQVFAVDAEPNIFFDDGAVEYLWERWGEQLRGMEWFLYHVMQKRKFEGAITADFLQAEGKDYNPPKGLY